MSPASSFGIGGGGIARRIGDSSLIERYRFDDSHDEPHINYEVALETSGRARPLLTKHTKLDELLAACKAAANLGK